MRHRVVPIIRLDALASTAADLSAWFPLSVGQLRCIERPSAVSKVNSLAWDATHGVLYLGGVFDAVDYSIVTTGLLLWTEAEGLKSFPGGGVGNYINGPSDAFVEAIVYDPDTEVTCVCGHNALRFVMSMRRPPVCTVALYIGILPVRGVGVLPKHRSVAEV